MGRFESAVGLRCSSGRAATFPLACPSAVGNPLKGNRFEGAWKYSTPGAPARIKGREGAKAERVGFHRGDRAGSCQSPGARGRTKRGFGIAWPRRGVPAPELLYGRLAGTYLWNSMPGGGGKPREGPDAPGRRSRAIGPGQEKPKRGKRPRDRGPVRWPGAGDCRRAAG